MVQFHGPLTQPTVFLAEKICSCTVLIIVLIKLSQYVQKSKILGQHKWSSYNLGQCMAMTGYQRAARRIQQDCTDLFYMIFI